MWHVRVFVGRLTEHAFSGGSPTKLTGLQPRPCARASRSEVTSGLVAPAHPSARRAASEGGAPSV
eukprot:4750484-Prymnesium_polylepis.1